VQYKEVLEGVTALASEFATQRKERQGRVALVKEDFDRLAGSGFLLTGVPAAMGGLWEGVAATTRPASELLRALARADSSVALVSSMHPAVLSFWLATPAVGEEAAAQREFVATSARNGAWWGTITSEPGSGGDITRTRATAVRGEDGGYLLRGQKHFGSGSGITSYMITTAVAEGEEETDWFYLDVRDAKWDGSQGMKLLAPWDGHGMAATQSHSFVFEGYPALRYAPGGQMREVAAAAGPFVGCLFTAVVLGIVQAAVEAAQEQLAGKREALRPYEKVEWTNATTDAWTMEQIYEGMLTAVEGKGSGALLDVLRGKTASARLAESVLSGICKVIGGGTFSRNSPFGFWYEDVRALGFLRPPWGLAYDQLFEASWPSELD
jgi:alkylation response protein AidB-like acyl-CoA dehydrogenase